MIMPRFARHDHLMVLDMHFKCRSAYKTERVDAALRAASTLSVLVCLNMSGDSYTIRTFVTILVFKKFVMLAVILLERNF